MPKDHRTTSNPTTKGQPHQIPADQLIHTMFQEMGIHDEKAEQRVMEKLKSNPDISTMDHVTQLIKECLDPSTSSSAELDVLPESSLVSESPTEPPTDQPRRAMKPPSISVE